jgi:hypothetical protein
MRRINSAPSIHDDQGKHPSNCLQKGVRKLHGNDLLGPFLGDRNAKPQVRVCALRVHFVLHMTDPRGVAPLVNLGNLARADSAFGSCSSAQRLRDLLGSLS